MFFSLSFCFFAVLFLLPASLCCAFASFSLMFMHSLISDSAAPLSPLCRLSLPPLCHLSAVSLSRMPDPKIP